MTSTFRASVIDALHTTMTSYVSAHPTTLTATYRARPASFGDLPCAYLGRRSEPENDEDSSTRRRKLRVEVVLVDRITDNVETLGRLDPLTDSVLDALSAARRSVTLYGPVTVKSAQDDELEINGVFYETVVITVEAEAEEGAPA